MQMLVVRAVRFLEMTFPPAFEAACSETAVGCCPTADWVEGISATLLGVGFSVFNAPVSAAEVTVLRCWVELLHPQAENRTAATRSPPHSMVFLRLFNPLPAKPPTAKTPNPPDRNNHQTAGLLKRPFCSEVFLNPGLPPFVWAPATSPAGVR